MRPKVTEEMIMLIERKKPAAVLVSFAWSTLALLEMELLYVSFFQDNSLPPSPQLEAVMRWWWLMVIDGDWWLCPLIPLPIPLPTPVIRACAIAFFPAWLNFGAFTKGKGFDRCCGCLVEPGGLGGLGSASAVAVEDWGISDHWRYCTAMVEHCMSTTAEHRAAS